MESIVLLGCAVCYGDPSSPLSKGAVAGVLVLGGAIVGMLVTFAGLFLFWLRRARALERTAAEAGSTGRATESAAQRDLRLAES